MLTFSPVWHGRLRAARGLTNLLMQTLVIHPALLLFLLFLLSAHHAGGAGQMLLNEAEKLVREAPAGQVWGCVPQDLPVKASLPVASGKPQHSAPVPDALTAAPTPVMCEKATVSREAWAQETSSTLQLLYKSAVALSVASQLVVWILRRQVKG